MTEEKFFQPAHARFAVFAGMARGAESAAFRESLRFRQIYEERFAVNPFLSSADGDADAFDADIEAKHNGVGRKERGVVPFGSYGGGRGGSVGRC